MKITAIDQMTHKPGMYRISVDAKPSGYVAAADVFELGLNRGGDINAEVYSRLLEKVKYNAFYASAIGYADRRLRSIAEIERYLKGRGCDSKTATAIAKKLVSTGLVDESKLAAAYVHDAELLKPLSRNMLELKLRQKRIDSDLIDASIQSAGYDDEQALDKLVRLKEARYAGNQPRFFRYLLRQGFSYTAIAKRIGKPERPKT